MLNKIPEFDLYYVAYLKDDPAKETIAASGKPKIVVTHSPPLGPRIKFNLVRNLYLP
jgi:hypothetical protein